MNYEELALTDIEVGQRRQERYEYYLAALVFTTLAFSLQTAKPSGILLVSFFEIGAWLFLFLSGLFALSRMYYLPVTFAYSAEINALRANIQKAKELEKKGHTELKDDNGEVGLIDEYITAHLSAINNKNEKSKINNKKLKWLNISHRILFLLGFMSLIASRSYTQMIGVLW